MRSQQRQTKSRSATTGAKICVALLACAAGFAQAQSSVTIYGTLDVGLTHINNVAGLSTTKLDDAIGSPSVLGFKGVEDLGGGLSAFFVLENRFMVDTGTSFPQLFNRGSFVGLKSSTWGTLTLGRQFDFFSTALPIDAKPFIEGGSISGYQGFRGATPALNPAVDVHDGTGQYDNSVKWEHTIGPFSGGLMYGLGAELPGQKMESAYLKYVAGPLQLGAGWTKDNFSTAIANQVYSVRGVYVVNDFTLLANYSEGKETVVAGSKAVARPLELAVNYQCTGNMTCGGGVGSARDTNRAGNRATLTQPFMSVRYNLSKRTQLYAVAAYNHSNNPSVIPSSFGVPGGVAGISSNASESALRLGITHRF